MRPEFGPNREKVAVYAIVGGIAQLARAVALQAIGLGFKSPYLHLEAPPTAYYGSLKKTGFPGWGSSHREG